MKFVIKLCFLLSSLLIQVTTNLAQSASAVDLLQKAKSVLSEKLANDYSAMELTALTTPKESPYAIQSYHAHMNTILPTAKRVCVWLSNSQQTIPVWFAVKAYQKVFVAKHQLTAHALAYENDFVQEKRDVAGLRSTPGKKLAKTIWLNTPLAAGEILLARQMTEPPQIAQGQQVKVKVSNHRITIFIEAQALKNAWLGQLVTMKNPANQKTFIARVSGQQKAEIAL